MGEVGEAFSPPPGVQLERALVRHLNHKLMISTGRTACWCRYPGTAARCSAATLNSTTDSLVAKVDGNRSILSALH